jgi:site-specific DNA recombinase
MTYAGELISCGFCGSPITGEKKIKKTAGGEREYIYYRCTRYNNDGHPRIRVREAQFDQQMIELFDSIRISNENIRKWFGDVLKARAKASQEESLSQRHELQRQATLLTSQQDRLLNLRLENEIDEKTFARKGTELRDRLARIKLQLDVLDRTHDENAELASKVFELSQSLRQQWVAADSTQKRRILEIIQLNCVLRDVTLYPEMRKPFDIFIKGLSVSESGGNRTRIELFGSGIATWDQSHIKLLASISH